MIDYEDEYQISRDPRDNRKTSRQWKPTIVAKVTSELDLAVAPTHGSYCKYEPSESRVNDLSRI